MGAAPPRSFIFYNAHDIPRYPSGPGVNPFSPTGPGGSDRSTSSSSDEAALDDSSSLSANTLRTGLQLGGKEEGMDERMHRYRAIRFY